MKPITQSITKHDPENDQVGDCFRACVCSILELDPANVPNFCEDLTDAWWGKFVNWLDEHGYGWCWSNEDPSDYVDYYIVSGKSPRGDWNHAVIYSEGKLAHDPHPEGKGTENIIDYMWFKKKVA